MARSAAPCSIGCADKPIRAQCVINSGRRGQFVRGQWGVREALTASVRSDSAAPKNQLRRLGIAPLRAQPSKARIFLGLLQDADLHGCGPDTNRSQGAQPLGLASVVLPILDARRGPDRL